MTASRISCPSASNSRGRPLGATAVAIRDFVNVLAEEYDRMTVRGVFYKLSTREVIEKSDRGYRQVQTQLLRMRRDGLLPWAFIADGTRWQRKPDSHRAVDAFLGDMVRTYRRDLWQSQDVRLEFWLEKGALADVIVDTTTAWDVSLMVSHGQSSATFLYNAAKAAEDAWQASGVETFVYAMYDRDAGGRRAARAIERELPAHAPGVPIHFDLLAVTDEQVDRWDLPTRPAKATDPEAARFDGPAVELDAIPPDKLNELVESAIRQHIDPRAWDIEQAIEREERAGLLALVEGGAR